MKEKVLEMLSKFTSIGSYNSQINKTAPNFWTIQVQNQNPDQGKILHSYM